MKKLTQEEVLNTLKTHYGESLDYSKVKYVNSRTPIILICPTHGEFEQYANNALRGLGGCPKCKLRISNKEEFIEAAKAKFGNKFNYEKVDFKTLSQKVIITCQKHGEFEIIPNHFLNSVHGCAKCYFESKQVEKSKKLSKEEQQNQKYFKWEAECKKIHKNKYNYSKVKYTDLKTKVCIICPIHGEFWQIPSVHKSGCGCPKCSYIDKANKAKLSQQEFEERANKIWNNKYKYGTYKSMHSYIEVTCPVHGTFLVTPHNHLNNCGCPECSKSSGEVIVAEFLKNNRIDYISQYKISIDKAINPSGYAYIDFYLPDYNIFIEYNGIQHYIPIEYFGGSLKFNQQVKRDEYVRNYCKQNSIKLIELPYSLNTEQIFNKLNKNINYDKV